MHGGTEMEGGGDTSTVGAPDEHLQVIKTGGKYSDVCETAGIRQAECVQITAV